MTFRRIIYACTECRTQPFRCQVENTSEIYGLLPAHPTECPWGGSGLGKGIKPEWTKLTDEVVE